MKKLEKTGFYRRCGRAGVFACALILVLSLLFASCSNDDEDTNPNPSPSVYGDFDSMAEFMYQAIKLCHPKMKEVWPDDGVNPADFNMILVKLPESEGSAPKAYFIDTERKTALTDTDLADGVIQGALSNLDSAGFVSLNYKGKKMTMMNSVLDDYLVDRLRNMGYTDTDLACEILDTFYHESFHFYVQTKGWVYQKSGGNREQEYPVDTEPREDRMLIDLALIQAYDNFDNQTARNEHYARAKYWLDKYKTNHAAEASMIKETDISEGTANYFGRAVISSVFPSYKKISLFERPKGETYASNIDGESYNLGSVSLNLIKKEGKIIEAIAASKQGTYTPAEFLLKDITASYTETSVDADDKSKIATAWQKTQTITAPLEPLIQDFTGGGKSYLVVYSQYSSSMGTYKFTRDDMKEFCGVITLGISTYEINVENISCLNANLKIADADTFGYYIIPVSDGELTFAEEANSEKKTIGIYPDSSSTSPKLADFTDVKSGKITAVTKTGITLKEAAKNKTAYKGTYKNNTFYCLPIAPNGTDE